MRVRHCAATLGLSEPQLVCKLSPNTEKVQRSQGSLMFTCLTPYKLTTANSKVPKMCSLSLLGVLCPDLMIIIIINFLTDRVQGKCFNLSSAWSSIYPVSCQNCNSIISSKAGVIDLVAWVLLLCRDHTVAKHSQVISLAFAQLHAVCSALSIVHTSRL